MIKMIKHVRVMQSCLYFLTVSDNMNSEVFGHSLVKGVGSRITNGWEGGVGIQTRGWGGVRAFCMLVLLKNKTIMLYCQKSHRTLLSCFSYLEHPPSDIRVQSVSVVLCGPLKTVAVLSPGPARNHFVEPLLPSFDAWRICTLGPVLLERTNFWHHMRQSLAATMLESWVLC